jgi:hypothetical protein
MFAARPLRAVRAPRAMRAAAVVATAAFVLLPWLYAVRELRHPEVVETVARPTAIVWGDRVFSSKSAFASWLRSTGVSYGEWARKHPDGLRTIDPKAYRKLTPAQRGVAATSPHRTAAPAAPAAAKKRKPAPTPAPAPTRTPTPTARDNTEAVAAQAEAPTSRVVATNARSTALMYSLLAVVLLLLTCAFLPPRLVAARAGPKLAAAQSYRLHLMVAASAISLGVFTSTLLN